jgi:hypothetical protein
LKALVLVAVLQLAAGSAQACLFATSTKPEGWHEWSSALFGGDVTNVAREKSIDVVTVRVAETFKGPDSKGGTLTVQLSNRYWTNCRVELPVAGARVLVAINPNGDAMLVPLSADYAEQLRQQRVTQPRP